EERDRNAEHRRVLAGGDRFAALDRTTGGRLTEASGAQEVGRDPEPDYRDDGHRCSEPPECPCRDDRFIANEVAGHPPGAAAAASISALRSGTLRSPTITWPLTRIVGVALTPAATAWLVSVRTAPWAAPVATQACHAPLSRPARLPHAR